MDIINNFEENKQFCEQHEKSERIVFFSNPLESCLQWNRLAQIMRRARDLLEGRICQYFFLGVDIVDTGIKITAGTIDKLVEDKEGQKRQCKVLNDHYNQDNQHTMVDSFFMNSTKNSQKIMNIPKKISIVLQTRKEAQQ